MRDLTGRVGAVTGGARGIGKATAQALAEAGMRVAIGDLVGEAARRAAASVGEGAIGLELDVTDRRSFAAFIDAAEAQLGPLDVLVNNAGIMHVGPFLEEDDATFERTLDINVRGVMHGMKIVVPRLRARGSGHLVNVASVAGQLGFPGGATYCGSKHFVVGVSEALHEELHGTGVAVSCVMPGLVNTELVSGLSPPRAARRIEPEDVGRAIVKALRRPRFEVYVPRSIGWSVKASGLVPRRLRAGLARALRWDRFLLDYDARERADYERRAAASG